MVDLVKHNPSYHTHIVISKLNISSLHNKSLLHLLEITTTCKVYRKVNFRVRHVTSKTYRIASTIVTTVVVVAHLILARS